MDLNLFAVTLIVQRNQLATQMMTLASVYLFGRADYPRELEVHGRVGLNPQRPRSAEERSLTWCEQEMKYFCSNCNDYHWTENNGEK